MTAHYGWDLPPGVRITDIPGNRPQDEAWDRALDKMDDAWSEIDEILGGHDGGDAALDVVRHWLAEREREIERARGAK